MASVGYAKVEEEVKVVVVAVKRPVVEEVADDGVGVDEEGEFATGDTTVVDEVEVEEGETAAGVEPPGDAVDVDAVGDVTGETDELIEVKVAEEVEGVEEVEEAEDEDEE